MVGEWIRNVFIKKAICNILLLSLIPTKRNLLSTIFDGPPLSPEREICDILLLSFIQTKWNQLSTDFIGPPFFQERSIVSHASVNQLLHSYALQEENILLHTFPNPIGICRQQTKFATFTLSLQRGKYLRSFPSV